MANGRIYWSEASAGVKGRLFWSEVESAPPDLSGRIYWSAVEAEAPSGLAGRIYWSDVVADAPPTIYTLTADAGAYVMTWAGSTSQVVLEADPGAYVMDWQDAVLTGPDPSGIYTLTADAGAYVMDWQDAVLTGPEPVDPTVPHDVNSRDWFARSRIPILQSDKRIRSLDA